MNRNILQQRLQDHTEQKQNEYPTYAITGKVKKKPLQFHFSLNVFITIVCIVVLLLAIYLPQFFIYEDQTGKQLIESNFSSLSDWQSYIQCHKDADFDGDGLKNYKEIEIGSDPYNTDTDKDGIADGFDSSPLTPDNGVEKHLISQGKTPTDSFNMNGVLLWADNKQSWVNGAVIEVPTGYQFSKFKGYAKFPTEKIPYQLVNGKHTPLKKHPETNAWKITQDCIVEFYEKEPESTYELSFLDHSIYINTAIAKALAAILPDTGWLTGQRMIVNDTFVSTQKNTYAEYSNVIRKDFPEKRFEAFGNRLSDLAAVYRHICDGEIVMVSLMSEKIGETVLVAYGYTPDGDLIVAAPSDKNIVGKLSFDICCRKSIDSQTGNIETTSFFEFAGCGYSTINGDKLSFWTWDK